MNLNFLSSFKAAHIFAASLTFLRCKMVKQNLQLCCLNLIKTSITAFSFRLEQLLLLCCKVAAERPAALPNYSIWKLHLPAHGTVHTCWTLTERRQRNGTHPNTHAPALTHEKQRFIAVFASGGMWQGTLTQVEYFRTNPRYFTWVPHFLKYKAGVK